MPRRSRVTAAHVLEPGEFFVRAQLDGRYAIHITSGCMEDGAFVTIRGVDAPREDRQLVIVYLAVPILVNEWKVEHTAIQDGSTRWLLGDILFGSRL